VEGWVVLVGEQGGGVEEEGHGSRGGWSGPAAWWVSSGVVSRKRVI
jgi:hypothetical protein